MFNLPSSIRPSFAPLSAALSWIFPIFSPFQLISCPAKQSPPERGQQPSASRITISFCLLSPALLPLSKQQLWMLFCNLYPSLLHGLCQAFYFAFRSLNGCSPLKNQFLVSDEEGTMLSSWEVYLKVYVLLYNKKKGKLAVKSLAIRSLYTNKGASLLERQGGIQDRAVHACQGWIKMMLQV